MKKPLVIEILILTLVFGVIFCIAIFAYSKIFIEPNVYTIDFKDIDGITKGSPVRFMGINIGHVKELKAKNNRSISTDIIITNKNIKIPNGTTARVEFYGLGGSKSIELMPPVDENSEHSGILTNKTIRIDDVVHEMKGLVEVIEIIERFVEDMNGPSMQETLYDISQVKAENINKMGKEFNHLGQEINKKIDLIREKQTDMIKKIDYANININKINKFIKK